MRSGATWFGCLHSRWKSTLLTLNSDRGCNGIPGNLLLLLISAVVVATCDSFFNDTLALLGAVIVAAELGRWPKGHCRLGPNDRFPGCLFLRNGYLISGFIGCTDLLGARTCHDIFFNCLDTLLRSLFEVGLTHGTSFVAKWVIL